MSDQSIDRLADGSPPAQPKELFRRLEELDIRVKTIQHPPVFTVDEAKALRGQIDGCHTKNLFLRNKKGVMWLVVCPEDRAVDLKHLAAQLGAGRLSFGSAQRLMKYLGVIPGAVSPFAIVNDAGGKVHVVLDRELLKADMLNFHPLDNSMTTVVRPEDFIRFLEAERHPPDIIRID
jgi:Ala-tRNA(Pro) deacylase